MPKTLKVRSKIALAREYRAVQKALKACPPDNGLRENLYAAQQALAWALNDNAMAASVLFNPKGPGSK